MPTTPDRDDLTIRCPAKLNLTLAVGSPRADGLHPIASVMVALRFSDTLTLKPLLSGPSRFVRRFADDAPLVQPIDWPVEKDLVYRAHALIEREIGRSLPIACVLDKRIPAGAGLGGGSSNAAGMLVGLRQLFDLPIRDARLVELGLTLGADVGFLVAALLGQRAVVVTGIGDVIEPIDTLPAFEVVLIFPDGVCPTGAVYAAFDAHSTPATPQDLAACVQAWRASPNLPPQRNDLADAAERVCPAIGVARSGLAQLGLQPRLTGSGSALFVIADHADHARQIASQARQAGLTALPTGYDP